jgi:hypothetical protein
MPMRRSGSCVQGVKLFWLLPTHAGRAPTRRSGAYAYAKEKPYGPVLLMHDTRTRSGIHPHCSQKLPT